MSSELYSIQHLFETSGSDESDDDDVDFEVVTGHQTVDTIIRDIDIRLPPEVNYRAYIHGSHFAFGFNEFDLKISVNMKRLDIPMHCHIGEHDLPRRVIDPIRVGLRDLLQRLLDDHLTKLTMFDAGMIVLQLVEDATSRIIEHRKASGGHYWDPYSSKSINPLLDAKLGYQGIDLNSVQDCATHILGKTPAEICRDILPDWKILHCENILRNDLQTKFLLNREDMRNNLQRFRYDELKKSVPIEHRRNRGQGDAAKDQLIEYLVRPRISFHGTARHFVPSIVRSGFLKPGDVHALTGKQLAVHNGSAYGAGIYSSPDPAYALLYSEGTDEKTNKATLPGMKLIISAVLMGRTAVIDYNDQWWNKTEPYPGADSHVSAPGTAYIVFNSAQILPCYVLHLNWNGSETEEMQEFLHRVVSSGAAGQKNRRAKAAATMAPGDVQRLKQERLAKGKKFFAYGFGPISGRDIVIEAVGEIDDDEEDYGEYQENRIDIFDGFGVEHIQRSNPWDWNLDGETQFDEYGTERKGQINRRNAKSEDIADGSSPGW